MENSFFFLLLYTKRKGKNWVNCRGIDLLNTSWKVYSKITFNRVNFISEIVILEVHNGKITFCRNKDNGAYLCTLGLTTMKKLLTE
jgi:hypothetical protein